MSTHKPEDIFSPQIDGLLSIADKISKEAKIDGVFPKGTSKKGGFEILNHRLHVVHVPHRWYAMEENVHGVNQLRVMGGVCDCCLRAGMKFYGGKGIVKENVVFRGVIIYFVGLEAPIPILYESQVCDSLLHTRI